MKYSSFKDICKYTENTGNNNNLYLISTGTLGFLSENRYFKKGFT